MEQKTDLRIQKTQAAIREAFFEIRRKPPLEKIKVRTICQRATINTSTFYNHYRDVQDLSDKLENELLACCASTIPDLGCLFADPYRFLTELRSSFSGDVQATELRILFDGRFENLHQKLDRPPGPGGSEPDHRRALPQTRRPHHPPSVTPTDTNS